MFVSLLRHLLTVEQSEKWDMSYIGHYMIDSSLTLVCCQIIDKIYF